MAPIKSTAFGYMSMSTDRVEEDNFLVGIGATYSTLQTSRPGNGYEYLFFTAPGYLSVGVGGKVDILLVGGGGAGGNGEIKPSSPTLPQSQYYAGGGGGAGGYLEKLNFTLPIGFYEIRVGSGGIEKIQSGGSPSIDRLGTSGDPSTITGPTITDLIAYGGGGGGGSFDSPPNHFGTGGSDGGSGGGASHTGGGGTGNRTTATLPATGSPIPSYLQNKGAQNVQGFPGGDSTGNVQYASGGGGAGGAGQSYPQISDAMNGGIGRAAFTDDPGIPPAYGTPGPTPGRYFAGGGGGGSSYGYGVGGSGGGGDGGDRRPPSLSQSSAGTVNTGGGGGGGNGTDPSHNYKGKSGGPGIIIIRYIPV